MRPSLALATLLLAVPLAGALAQAGKPPQRAPAIAPQAPTAGRPANATAACNDGTFWSSRERQGACAGHRGVRRWFAMAPPSHATARCSDGTYWTNPVREGACTGHGGVKEWFRGARPANATAECADGTFWTSHERQGACSGHGGVRAWFGTPRGQPPSSSREQ
jgi:hypothetical protein